MKNFLKTKYKLFIIIVLIVVLGFGTFYAVKAKTKKKTTNYVEITATKKNIEVLVNGTGTITSTDKADIISKVSGTVTNVYYSEGDTVKPGDLLVQLDDTSAKNQVERTKLSIKQAQQDLENAKENISNLNVTSPIQGQVSNIPVNIGDNINKGSEICTVTDTTNLKLVLPFNANQIKNIRVGENANVYLQDFMDVVEGTVSYIGSSPKAVDGGGNTYSVEIAITNPGTLKSGIRASAQIANEISIDSSAIQYKDSRKVRALAGGTVKEIKVREDDKVKSGQTLIVLENDDLNTQVLSSEIKLNDLQVSLDTQTKELSDYKIYAYQEGIIIKQNVKVGDVLRGSEVASSSNSIISISNPKVMQFDITVDELDIVKISTGMDANVTIDALPNKTFKGVVTKVSAVGTSSNGVTTYPVTVSIKNPESVKEGMNANADILVQNKENVLTVPITAVQKIGNQSFVIVKGKDSAPQGANEDRPRRDNTNSASQPQENSNRQNTGNRSNNGNRAIINNKLQSTLAALGTDATLRRVETGINNDTDIEIVNGLKEGDIILRIVTSTSNANAQSSMMPFGGASGGAPSGGNFVIRQTTVGGNSSRQGGGSSGGR